mgnify:CR=1 FL=1
MMAENAQEDPKSFVNLEHPWQFDGECTIHLVDGGRKTVSTGINWDFNQVTVLEKSGNPGGIYRENHRVKEIRTAKGRLLWVNHGHVVKHAV